jgi:rare lipoprotein A
VTAHSYPSYESTDHPEPVQSNDTLQSSGDTSPEPSRDSTRVLAAPASPDTAIPPSSWEEASIAPQSTPDTLTGKIERGVAAWYGPGFERRKTASGERFDSRKFTAAHKTLPFNTLVKVTSLRNGMSVVVRINDRGPFGKNRIIDLSTAAARAIGLDRSGTADVSVEPLQKQAP